MYLYVITDKCLVLFSSSFLLEPIEKIAGREIYRKQEVIVMIFYLMCANVVVDRCQFAFCSLALLLSMDLNRSLLNSLWFYDAMHNTLYHMCAFVGKFYSSNLDVAQAKSLQTFKLLSLFICYNCSVDKRPRSVWTSYSWYNTRRFCFTNWLEYTARISI